MASTRSVRLVCVTLGMLPARTAAGRIVLF